MADEPQTPNTQRERRKEEILRQLSMERIQLEPWYLDVRSEIVKPDQVTITTRYFWDRWAPKFGPLLTCLLLRLRQYCYYNRATGEKRDWCFPSQETLGAELGVHDETIRTALQKLEALGFVRREKQYRYDATSRRSVRTTDKYYVLMEEPIAPEDEGEALVKAAERMLADAGKDLGNQRNPPKAEISPYGATPVDNRPTKAKNPPYYAGEKSARKRYSEGVLEQRNVALDAQGTTHPDPVTDLWPTGPTQVGDTLRTRFKRRSAPKEKHLSDVLPQISTSPEKRDELLRVEDLTGQMLEQLGDSRSRPFYRLVARRFLAGGCEQLVYQTLSEIKEGHRAGTLRNPAAVFTARIKELAAAHDIEL